jgi:hypothetical protein
MAIKSLLFYAVYLSQVLLISYYLPTRILRHARRLIETFPPSEYPKLYPEPLATIDRKLRVYRIQNTGLLLLGLGLLAGAWLSDYQIAAKYGAYPTMVAHAIYSMLQVSPLVVFSLSGLAYYKRMRAAARGRLRTAELKARRLFEFVSPALLGTAAATYVGAVGSLLLFEGRPGWLVGGLLGWLSLHRQGVMIASLTIYNALFAGIIAWSLYGRKQDPYQTYEDRARQIQLVAQGLLMASILFSVFIAGFNLLSAFELELWHYGPLLYSVFLQVGLTACLRFFLTYDPFLSFNPDSFEVYKANPA